MIDFQHDVIELPQRIANARRNGLDVSDDGFIATPEGPIHVDDWSASDELDLLRKYADSDCRCPCCDETRHCVAGCTLQADAMDAWERMQAARKAILG